MRGIEVYEPELEFLVSGKMSTIIRESFGEYRGFVVFYRSRNIHKSLCAKNGVDVGGMNRDVFAAVGRLLRVKSVEGGYIYYFTDIERIKEVRFPVKVDADNLFFKLPEELEVKIAVAGWDGVYYKVPCKMMKKTQVVLCHALFVGNPYKRCSHGCLYCYVDRHLSRYSGKYSGWKPVPLDITLLEKAFERAKNGAKDLTSICIRNRYILRLGNMTDPLQPVERHYRITQKYLEMLNKEKYPYFLCTKSDMVVEEPYISYLKAPNVGFVQMSLPSLNKKFLSVLEPNVPSPSRRLKAMERLTDEGIKVQVRVSPFMPVIMDDWRDLFDKLRDVGVYHVITQCLLPDKALLREMRDLFGINYMKMVQDAGFNYDSDETGVSTMNDVVPEHGTWVRQCGEFKEYLDELGISYGGCMIAPEHMTTESCCGLDNWYHHRATVSEVLLYLRKNKRMTWEDARRVLHTPSWKEVKKVWDAGMYEATPEIRFDAKNNCYIYDGDWVSTEYPEGVRISKGLDKY